MKFAIINSDGLVQNVVVVDESSTWRPDVPAGGRLVTLPDETSVGPGDMFTDAGEPAPPAPPPPAPIPTSVTMRQARLALLGADLLDDVEAAIEAIPDETKRRAARIEWEFASTVDRGSDFVQSLKDAIGLDDTILDDLFTTAAAL